MAGRSGGKTKRNKWFGLALIAVPIAMVGAAYASVPLYQLFCQVTGYAGTTQVASAAPEAAGERVFTIRFDSSVDPKLPWAFQPVERQMTLRIGESGLALFRARNLSDRKTAGTATFNVTPLKAGQYFNKVQCFCFTEQHLAPGASADMPVSFFVDPAIDKDPNLREVKTITLSYTFFPDEQTGDEQQLGRLETPEAGGAQTVN